MARSHAGTLPPSRRETCRKGTSVQHTSSRSRARRVPRVLGDQLTMPTEQRLWLHREARPRRPRQRATHHRQKCTVTSGDVWTAGLSAQDRQFVSQGQDLQLLRVTRPGQQRHKCEQVPDGEIDKRPEQARASPLVDGKSADTTRARPYPRRKARVSLRTLRVRPSVVHERRDRTAQSSRASRFRTTTTGSRRVIAF